MADFVAFPNGRFAIHPDVQFDKKSDPAFAYTAFLHIVHAWHRLGGFLDRANVIGIDIPVEDFVQRPVDDQDTVRHDDDTREESGVVIRHFPSRPANERNGDSDGGGAGSDRVGSMMPSISFGSSAID